jgi:hypothetical protein
MLVSVDDVKAIAKTSFSISENDALPSSSNETFIRKFRSLFGCSPLVCSTMYNKLVEQNLVTEKDRVLHLMWALVFLKLYSSENALCTLLKCSEKTLRKWVWYFLDKCSQIDLVRTYIYSLRSTIFKCVHQMF